MNDPLAVGDCWQLLREAYGICDSLGEFIQDAFVSRTLKGETLAINATGMVKLYRTYRETRLEL